MINVSRAEVMARRDIVVVGASAGGVEALMDLVRGLPADLPAAVFVVLHIPPQSTSVLPQILDRAGPLPARHAVDGAPIIRGQILVAPPDHHLLVEQGHIRLSRGPRENRTRPAVDPLFRSAARTYGPRVLGVVLSGALDDGTSGLAAIKARGGVAIVQDPAEAIFPSMAQSAIDHVAVDHILFTSQIGPLLAGLAREDVVEEGAPAVSRELDLEVEAAAADGAVLGRHGHPGIPSSMACPECGGSLWELGDGGLLRFRCRVGHAFSSGSLLAEQAEQLEGALWAALWNLDEQANLNRRRRPLS